MRAAFLLTVWLMLGAGLPARADDPRALAAKLAHPDFHDREAASRRLLALGPAAIPVLEDVTRSGPPEAVRRAARALAAIRMAEDSRQAVGVKPVSLNFQGKPLAAAVAEVRAVCDVNVVLDPKAVTDPNRPVTVRTGPLPPWQAVEAFRAAARLREMPPPELDKVSVEKARVEAAYLVVTTATARPSDVPLVWRDGDQPVRAVTAADGLRVMALPTVSRDPANGTVTLTLDVTTTAGVNWQRTDEVRIGRAEMPDGRHLEPVFQANPNAALLFNWTIQREEQVLGDWRGPGSHHLPTLPPPVRLFPIALATGPRPTDALKALEGVVCGEVHRPNQSLLEIDDLTAAVGRTFDGPLGSTLTVDAVKADELVLRCDAVSPWVLRQQGQARAGAIADAGFNETLAARVKVYDAAGREFPRPTRIAANGTGNDSGTRVTTTFRFTFPRVGPDERTKPVKLVVHGTKVAPVRVPFRLENVPLR